MSTSSDGPGKRKAVRTRARGEEQQGWQPQPNFFNSIWVSLRDILKWKWRRGGSGPIPFQWTLTAPNGTEFKVDCYYTQLKPVLEGAGMKLDGTDKLITRPNSGAAIPSCAVLDRLRGSGGGRR